MAKYELDRAKFETYIKANKCSEEDAGVAIKGLIAILSEKYYVTADKQAVPKLIVMIPRKPTTPEQEKFDFERNSMINLGYK